MKYASQVMIAVIALLCLVCPATAGISSVRGPPPSNWAIVVSLDDPNTRGDFRPAAEDGERLVDILSSRYGYADSQIRHISGNRVTASQLRKEIASIAQRTNYNDSIAVFIFTDVLYDPRLGHLILTSEGEKFRERLLSVDSVKSELQKQKTSASDIFIFMEACDKRAKSRSVQSLTRAPVLKQLSPASNTSRADTNQSSVLSGCQWTITRDEKNLKSEFVNIIAENQQSVFTISALRELLSKTLPNFEFTLQMGLSTRPFQFVLSTAMLDASALATLGDSSANSKSRRDALRLLSESALVEYRANNGSPLQTLQNTLLEIAVSSEESREFQSVTVESMAEFPDAEAEESLLAVLADESGADAEVKSLALKSLGSIGSPKADEEVTRYLSHKEKSLREDALSIVEARGIITAVNDIFAQFNEELELDTKKRQLDVLHSLASKTQFNEQNIGTLHKIAIDEAQPESMRIQAISVVGVVASPDSVNTVLKLASHADSADVREVSIFTLGRLDIQGGDKEKVVTELIDYIASDEEKVATAAIYTLGEIGALESRGIVLEALISPATSVNLKITSAEAIGKLKGEGAVDALAGALVNDDQVLRITAIEALKKIGTTDAARALVKAFADDNKYIRSAALDAFRKINPPRLDISAELRESIESANDPEIKALYLDRLSAVDDKAMVDVFINALRSEYKVVSEAAMQGLVSSRYRREVLNALRLFATSANVRDRIAGARALGAIDDADAAKILEAQIDEEDLSVLEVAIQSLGKHTNSHAQEVLWDIVDQESRVSILALDALSTLGNNLYSNGEYDAAITLVERVAAAREYHVGRSDPALALDYNNLAAMNQKAGNLEVAEDLLLRAVSIHRSRGFESLESATYWSNLGYVYIDQATKAADQGGIHDTNELYASAESAFEASLNIRQSVLGEYSPQVADSYESLATVNRQMGLEDVAQNYDEDAASIRRKIRRPESLNGGAKRY